MGLLVSGCAAGAARERVFFTWLGSTSPIIEAVRVGTCLSLGPARDRSTGRLVADDRAEPARPCKHRRVLDDTAALDKCEVQPDAGGHHRVGAMNQSLTFPLSPAHRAHSHKRSNLGARLTRVPAAMEFEKALCCLEHHRYIAPNWLCWCAIETGTGL